MGVAGEATTVIDGIAYTTRVLPTSEGLRVLPKIGRLFKHDGDGSHPLVKMFDAFMAAAPEDPNDGTAVPSDDEKTEGRAPTRVTEVGILTSILSDVDNLMHLATELCERADEMPGGIDAIAKSLVKYMTSDKVRVGESEISGSILTHFDTHFAGRYIHLLKVLGWAARVSFGGP